MSRFWPHQQEPMLFLDAIGRSIQYQGDSAEYQYLRRLYALIFDGTLDARQLNEEFAKVVHALIRANLIRDLIDYKLVQLQLVPSKLQLADPLTKSLGPKLFSEIVPLFFA